MQKKSKLTRDIEVIQVPFGIKAMLPKGTSIAVMQQLGGSFTVIVQGSMYRVEDRDADALDLPPQEVSSNGAGDSLEDSIWTALRTCYDPEIPVNIVDLGLIYGVEVEELAEQKHGIKIRMTLTSPSCGMGPFIVSDVKNRLLALVGVTEVAIEMIFDPPWDRSMMSEQARLDLGLL